MGDVIVWISGASGGIGRALSETVPWDGARVINVSRRELPGTQHLAADLSEPAGWETVRASFDHELAGFAGDRAVFVHCAASLQPLAFAAEADPDAYARTVLLNTASTMVLGQAFVHAARDADCRTDLVMLTSGAASSVYEGWSLYGPAKAALDHWVRHVGAEEARRDGRCRVIAVAPGVVATAMQEEIRDTDPGDFPQVGKFVGLHERGELRDPHDAARGIWALLDHDLDNGAVVDLRDR